MTPEIYLNRNYIIKEGKLSHRFLNDDTFFIGLAKEISIIFDLEEKEAVSKTLEWLKLKGYDLLNDSFIEIHGIFYPIKRLNHTKTVEYVEGSIFALRLAGKVIEKLEIIFNDDIIFDSNFIRIINLYTESFGAVAPYRFDIFSKNTFFSYVSINEYSINENEIKITCDVATSFMV